MDTPNQNQPQSGQPQIHQTVVVIGKQKSVGVAFLLAFLFGPLGLLYASVTGGIVMFLLGIVIGIITLGFGLILVWIGSIIWAVVAANNANQRMASGAGMHISANVGGQPQVRPQVQPTPQTIQQTIPQPIEQNIPQQSVTETQVYQQSYPLETPTKSSFDFGEWFEKNKKSVFIGAGSIVGLLLLFVAVKFIINLDFSKKQNNDATPTQVSQPVYETTTPSQTNSQTSTLGKFPQTSDRLLTSDDIYNLNKYDLKIMRNEIYARHGYRFKTQDMKSYFQYQAWYSPRYDDVTSFLTETEKRNITLIKRYE